MTVSTPSLSGKFRSTTTAWNRPSFNRDKPVDSCRDVLQFDRHVVGRRQESSDDAGIDPVIFNQQQAQNLAVMGGAPPAQLGEHGNTADGSITWEDMICHVSVQAPPLAVSSTASKYSGPNCRRRASRAISQRSAPAKAKQPSATSTPHQRNATRHSSQASSPPQTRSADGCDGSRGCEAETGIPLLADNVSIGHLPRQRQNSTISIVARCFRNTIPRIDYFHLRAMRYPFRAGTRYARVSCDTAARLPAVQVYATFCDDTRLCRVPQNRSEIPTSRRSGRNIRAGT